MPKTLEHIWNELKPGNILAYQTRSNWDGTKHTNIEAIKICTVVAVDIWDMAMVAGVVDLCKFDCYGIKHKEEKLPEIEWLAEWSDFYYIVGLWSYVPPISEVKRAIREFRLTDGVADTHSSLSTIGSSCKCI